jgi:hypothetical protein
MAYNDPLCDAKSRLWYSGREVESAVQGVCGVCEWEGLPSYIGVAWSVWGTFPEYTPALPAPIDDRTVSARWVRGAPTRAQAHLGREHAWARPPRPLLRVASLWLGLGCGGAMGWPRFGPLVGFFLLSWHYAFPNGAFFMYSTCIWCIFL